MIKHNYSSLTGLICLLILIAGCQDTQILNPENSVNSMDANIYANGAAAPGTIVTGEGEFGTENETIIRESGPGNGAGTCEAGGAWRNPAGNLSGPVPHDQCKTVIEGSVVEISFSENTNFVQAKSGNINLNFQEIEDAYIHYQYKKNITQGEGIIIATDDNSNEWTIDLSQVNGPGNWFANDPLELTAVNGDDSVQLAISW